MVHIRPRPLSWKPNRTEEERSKWRFKKQKSNINQEPLYFTVCDPAFSHAFSLDGNTHFLFVKNQFYKQRSHHLFSFYFFKRKNKIRKKNLRK